MAALKNKLSELLEKLIKKVVAFLSRFKPSLVDQGTPVLTEPQKPVVEPPRVIVDPIIEPITPPKPPVIVEPPKPQPPVEPPVVVPEPELPKPVARGIGIRIPAGETASNMPEIVACNFTDLGVIDKLLGQGITFGVNKNESVVFRFVTGHNMQQLTIGCDEHTSMGCMSPRFVTVSETFGDFDYSKIDAHNGGSHKIMLGGDSLNGTVEGTWPYFKLKPNTIYFLNMRFEDARVGNRGKIAAPCDVVGQVVHFH